MTGARRRAAARRIAAALVGVFALGAASSLSEVPATEASWQDAEVGSAQFTAATVPVPVAWGSPQCEARTVLLVGGQITIRWRLPEGATGYSADDVEFGQEIDGVLDPILSGLLGSTETTGTPSGYTTVVSGGLLSNLLGGSSRFGMRLTGPGDWASPWLVANVTFPALVGAGTCTLSTGS